MTNTTKPAQGNPNSKKWILIPIIFAIWTSIILIIFKMGIDRIPIISKLSATMDFELMKEVLASIKAAVYSNSEFMLFFTVMNFI